jgi:hypothetical protein
VLGHGVLIGWRVRLSRSVAVGVAFMTEVNQGLTVTVWDGDLSVAEWRDQVETLISSKDLRRCDRFLTDVRGAGDVSTIDDTAIRAMAARFSVAASVGAQVALVAPQLFNGAQTFRDAAAEHGLRTRVFLDMASACDFLAVDVEAVALSVEQLRKYIRSAR